MWYTSISAKKIRKTTKHRVFGEAQKEGFKQHKLSTFYCCGWQGCVPIGGTFGRTSPECWPKAKGGTNEAHARCMALGAQQLWRWGWSKRWEKCFEPLRNHQKIAGLGSWVARGGLGWSLPLVSGPSQALFTDNWWAWTPQATGCPFFSDGSMQDPHGDRMSYTVLGSWFFILKMLWSVSDKFVLQLDLQCTFPTSHLHHFTTSPCFFPQISSKRWWP